MEPGYLKIPSWPCHMVEDLYKLLCYLQFSLLEKYLAQNLLKEGKLPSVFQFKGIQPPNREGNEQEATGHIVFQLGRREWEGIEAGL